MDDPKHAMALVQQPAQSAEFKRWVLFVRDGDRGSAEAMKHVVAMENECLVRDVDSTTARPAWLTAVPTLLDVAAKRKYEGSAAIHKLREAIESEPLPYDNVTRTYYTFGDGDAWGGPARTADFILPTVARDGRYAAATPVTPADVDAYWAGRSQACITAGRGEE
jgi:hypothetical protein